MMMHQKKPKWNGDISVNDFLKAQETEEFKCKLDEFLSRQCKSENDVMSLNSDVVELYHILASSKETKSTHNPSTNKNKNQRKNGKRPKRKWFD